MELRVFRLSVMCYLICVLCRNAFGGSTLAKVFPSINDASQRDSRMLKIRDTRIERSIETETRLDTITLMDDRPKLETPRKSQLMQDLSAKTKTLNDFRKAKCSRYCLQQLGTEDISLSWSFAENQSEGDNFSLENNEIANLKILKRMSIDKSSTILNDCQIYLDFDCDINMEDYSINQNDDFYSKSEFNNQRIKTLKNLFWSGTSESKILVHRTNMSEYTETNFDINANVTGIIMNISGNVTRAILSIPTNRTMQRTEVTMSLPLIYTRGVAIGARNLPPGGWCVKLTGAENLKYNFVVIAYFEANKENDTRNNIHTKLTSEFNKKENFNGILNEERIAQSKATTFVDEIKQFNGLEKKAYENIANNQTNSILLVNATNKKPKSIFERSVEIIDLRSNDDEAMMDSSDISLSSLRSTTVENLINYSVLHSNPLMSYGYFKIPQNASDNRTFNGKIFALEQQQKIQARSSEAASLNEDIDMNVKSSTNDNVSMQMINRDQTQELSAQLTKNSDDPFDKKRILLDINANSNLIATPGTTHRVIFDVTNNCILMVIYAIEARSSPFRIFNIQPRYMRLQPGQISSVAVDIIIPFGIQDTVNTLTLFIAGTEIWEKTVYVYVQSALYKIIDNTKPTIEYSFNSNCAGKLNKDNCEKTLWSADITVQDSDSGLKRVVSTPNGIYQRTKYISGTKERVAFYYTSTCCSTTATITAIDISENQYTRTLDVTVWDNLSQGEIAAITLGALLLLLLLIIIIISIVYCFRKKNSHDLPYTQRYGSRPPARSERTSF